MAFGPRIIRLFALTMLLILSAAHLRGDDDPLVRLEKAKAAYSENLAKSKSGLMDRYRAELAKLKTSDAKQVVLLTEEMKVFADSGIMVGRSALMQDFVKYSSSNHAALESLRKEYAEAVRGLNDGMRRDDGDRIQNELAGVRLSGELKSLRLGRTQRFVMHADYQGLTNGNLTNEQKINAVFEIVPGLADQRYVSIRSANVPDHYLAHGDFRIRLQAWEDTDVFRKNATFKLHPTTLTPDAVMLESFNLQKQFIQDKDGKLWVRPLGNDLASRLAATFSQVEPEINLREAVPRD